MTPIPTLILDRLAAARVLGIEGFRAKLVPNAINAANYRDLVSEACAALTFAEAGFVVELRDSPDLRLDLHGQTLFAEVKHFRRKRQDDIDDQRLRNASGRVVRYGDTVPLEAMAAAEQVVAVARRKASQMPLDAANILVLESSSTNCVEECEIADAIGIIDEIVATDAEEPLRRLNGILFLSPSYSCSRHRSVYFFEACAPAVELSPLVRDELRNIREWIFVLAS